MSDQEIIEGNKLIAKFMGKNKSSDQHYAEWTAPEYLDGKFWASENFMRIESPDGNNLLHPSEMKFCSDWNWLMPVVEKIESLGFWINIKKNHVTVAWDNKGSFDSKMIHSEFGDLTKIERVYSCVVEFIKWHNYQMK